MNQSSISKMKYFSISSLRSTKAKGVSNTSLAAKLLYIICAEMSVYVMMIMRKMGKKPRILFYFLSLF